MQYTIQVYRHLGRYRLDSDVGFKKKELKQKFSLLQHVSLTFLQTLQY